MPGCQGDFGIVSYAPACRVSISHRGTAPKRTDASWPGPVDYRAAGNSAVCRSPARWTSPSCARSRVRWSRSGPHTMVPESKPALCERPLQPIWPRNRARSFAPDIRCIGEHTELIGEIAGQQGVVRWLGRSSHTSGRTLDVAASSSPPWTVLHAG